MLCRLHISSTSWRYIYMRLLSVTVTIILQMLPLFFILIKFFSKDLKKPMWSLSLSLTTIIILFALGIVQFAPLYNSIPFIHITISICGMIIMVIVIKSFTAYSIGQAVFIIFLYKNFIDNVQLFNASILLMQGKIPSRYEDLNNVIYYIILIIALFPILYLYIQKLLMPLLKSHISIVFWNYLSVAPIFFYIIYRLGIYPGYLGDAPEVNQEFYFLPFVWVMGTSLVYYISLRILTVILENIKLSEELHYSDLLIATHEYQVKSLQHSIESEQRVRHDFRHSLIALSYYAKEGDCHSILMHIKDSLTLIGTKNGAPLCGNLAISTIIRHFMSLAEAQKIPVTSSFSLPERLDFSEMDLCIIIGNLFENAVEACCRQTGSMRFIDISICLNSPRILSIVIKNSFEGDISYQDNGYLSAKRKGKGIGLSSVAHICDIYHGIMRVESENHIFTVSLLLNSNISGD